MPDTQLKLQLLGPVEATIDGRPLSLGQRRARSRRSRVPLQPADLQVSPVWQAMATDTRAVGQAAALAIGATVGLEALFAGPISGASMNPARSLAPALLSGTWTGQWVYLLAPLLGAVLGAYVYRWLRDTDKHLS